MYQTLQREGGGDDGLRLLLIGKTRSGKSATGNIIFNDRVFESETSSSSSSVTRVSQKHTGAVINRRVTVIDTPDFIFSTHTDFDSDSELKRALELCEPGAHVILLLLPLNTFAEHEMDFIHLFKQMFGQEAFRFTLLLFTHPDQRNVRSPREIIGRIENLSDFINQYGQRYHEFNIKAPANRQQVTELMEKVDRLVSENRNSCYTLEMIEDKERRREEKERRAEKEKKAEKERTEKEHQMKLESVREETESRVRKEYEQMSLKEKRRAEEEKKADKERTEKEHQMKLESVREKTEKSVRTQHEKEKDKIKENGKTRDNVSWLERVKKYVKNACISVTCYLVLRKDSFMRGLITHRFALTAGVIIGIDRILLRSSKIENLNTVRMLLMIMLLQPPFQRRFTVLL